MVDALEKQLTDSQWIGGQLPTAADREAFESIKTSPPNVATHPHTFAWWVLVAKFTDAVRASWTGAAAAPAAPKKAAKAAPAKEEPKKEEPKKEEDDDDFDPFAEDEEDDIEDRIVSLHFHTHTQDPASPSLQN